MKKECVVLDGNVINIGEWDYQYEQIEIKPSVIDEETQEVIKEAEYETIVRNPLPDGANKEEREFSFDDAYGWHETKHGIPKTEAEMMQEENAMLAVELVETQIRLDAAEAEQANLLLELVNKGVL